MMNSLLNNYSIQVNYPDVSGAEQLEIMRYKPSQKFLAIQKITPPKSKRSQLIPILSSITKKIVPQNIL